LGKVAVEDGKLPPEIGRLVEGLKHKREVMRSMSGRAPSNWVTMCLREIIYRTLQQLPSV